MKVSLMGYNIDVWPSGFKVNDQVQTFNKQYTAYPAKEWVKAWTKLHAGALDKYITQQVNHIDIIELGAMKAQTFVLNFVMLFSTCVIIAEELYYKRDKKLQWALYIQLGFSVVFGIYLLVNKASYVKIAALFFFGMDVVQFVLLFWLIGFTEGLGATEKPYIVNWCVINSVLILCQTIHMILLNRRQQALEVRIVAGAIYSAQANNEGLKSIPMVNISAIKQQQPEMKFETQEVEMPELRMVVNGSSRKSI